MSSQRLAGTCSMYELQHFFGYATKEKIETEVTAAIKHYFSVFGADNRDNPPVIIYNHSDRGGGLQVWLDCGFIPMYTYMSPHHGNITVTHLVYGKVIKWEEGTPIPAAKPEEEDEEYYEDDEHDEEQEEVE